MMGAKDHTFQYTGKRSIMDIQRGIINMNVLFFLKPKSEVAYLYEDYSLRQALEKMEYHRYTAIPIISR